MFQPNSKAGILLLAVAATLLLAGCLQGGSNTQGATTTTVTTAGSNSQIAQQGDTVVVDYTLYLQNGTIFDSSIESDAKAGNLTPRPVYQPLSFAIGSPGLLPAFEAAVVGMSVGSEKNITLSADKGYGYYDPTLVFNTSLAVLENLSGSGGNASVVVGAHVTANNGMRGVITHITNGTVFIDFNSPLAGQVLVFKIILRSIPLKASGPTSTQ